MVVVKLKFVISEQDAGMEWAGPFLTLQLCTGTAFEAQPSLIHCAAVWAHWLCTSFSKAPLSPIPTGAEPAWHQHWLLGW